MIKGEITGGEKLAVKLDALPADVRQALKDGIARGVLKLLVHVKQNKLSGQVLKVKTGRLRRSINSRVESSGSGVVGIVGTNVEYAAAHEFGFSGVEQVRNHLRMVKQAWGKELRAPHQANVGAHGTRMKLPERSFLRSALRDMEGQLTDEIRKAVEDAIRKRVG